MADVTRVLFVRHLRADTSSHVLHYKGEQLVRSGRGLSFWFLPMSASVAEVPVDDREVSVIVHGRSSDYQDVAVQGVVTYRVADPRIFCSRRCLTSTRGRTSRPRPFAPSSPRATRASVRRWRARCATTPRSTTMGIEIVSVRVSSVAPSPELERALEAPTREHIQQVSDEAAFSRRAMAVDKERAIQENALQNHIELAKREEQLIGQTGANTRQEATEKAQAERIAAESAAARAHIEGEAKAAGIRMVEGAKVEVERARIEIFQGLPTSVMMGMAAQELAGKLKSIDRLNIGEAALGPMIQQLIEAGTKCWARSLARSP